MRRPDFLIVFLFAAIWAFSPLGCDCGGDNDDSGASTDDDSVSDDTATDDTVSDDTGDDTVDDDTGPDVSDLIESGKNWLKIGEGDKARLDFLAALDLVPDHPEGLFGLVLSDAVHDLDIVSIIYDYILAFIENGGPVKDDSDNLLDNILELALTGLLFERSDELVEYAQQCHDIPDIQFLLDSIPVIIHFEHVADLGTEFDQAEVYGAESLALLLPGLLHHLTAVSVDIDMSYGFQIVDIADLGLPTLDMIGAIVNVLIDMLEDENYPDFLTLPPDNVPEFQAAGMSLGDGSEAFLQTFASIRAETDDPSDDVLSYQDGNGNFVWDGREPFVVPGHGILSTREMRLLNGLITAAEDLRNSFWDYTDKDIDPDNPNPFPLADLNPILLYLGIPPLIIDMPLTRVDIGATYVNPGHDEFKQTLLTILNTLDLFLPDPIY